MERYITFDMYIFEKHNSKYDIIIITPINNTISQ